MRRVIYILALVPLFLFASPHRSLAATKIYVTDPENNAVHVVDANRRTVTATIPVANGPAGIASNNEGTKVYVAHRGDSYTDPCQAGNTLSVIDTATNTVINSIEVGVGPMHLALNHSNGLIYVSNTGCRENGKTVSVVDVSTESLVDTISLDACPWDIAISADDSLLYVGTSDNVSVIDAEANDIASIISGVRLAYGLALNPSGTRLYVTYEDGPVSVIDSATESVIDTIEPTTDESYEIDQLALSPSGDRLYVPIFGWSETRGLSVIDTSNNEVIKYVELDAGFCYDVDVTQDGKCVFVLTAVVLHSSMRSVSQLSSTYPLVLHGLGT